MRKMWSKGQIKTQISGASAEVVAALAGQDIAPKDVTASGNITGKEIIENMSGYSFAPSTPEQMIYDFAYAGVCKNGNKITFVIAGTIKRVSSGIYTAPLGNFEIPSSIGQKLYPAFSTTLEYKTVYCAIDQETGVTLPLNIVKASNTYLSIKLDKANTLTQDQTYFIRAEVTFLLSENLAQE